MNARFTGRGNDLPLCLADIAAAPLQVAEDNFDYDDCYDGDDEAERGDHAVSAGRLCRPPVLLCPDNLFMVLSALAAAVTASIA